MYNCVWPRVKSHMMKRRTEVEVLWSRSNRFMLSTRVEQPSAAHFITSVKHQHDRIIMIRRLNLGDALHIVWFRAVLQLLPFCSVMRQSHFESFSHQGQTRRAPTVLMKWSVSDCTLAESFMALCWSVSNMGVTSSQGCCTICKCVFLLVTLNCSFLLRRLTSAYSHLRLQLWHKGV